jgi:hypothetical protein
MIRPPGDPGDPSETPARLCFEMRISTVMSTAVVPSLPVRVTRTAVVHGSMYSMLVDGRRDIADVVDRLERCGVRVVDIRAWDRPDRPTPCRGGTPPPGGADPTAPVADDPAVVALTAVGDPAPTSWTSAHP